MATNLCDKATDEKDGKDVRSSAGEGGVSRPAANEKEPQMIRNESCNSDNEYNHSEPDKEFVLHGREYQLTCVKATGEKDVTDDRP